MPMSSMLIALLVPIGLATLAVRDRADRPAIAAARVAQPAKRSVLGAVVNFFDTLGHRLVRADHRVAQVPQARLPTG